MPIAQLLLSAPKCHPHIENMRENIASAIEADVSQISIKATTEEHLGFTGEGLGIAAHAIVLLEKE